MLTPESATAGGYHNAGAASALLPALRWLDGALERATVAARTVFGQEAAADPFRGLHISPHDVQQLLDRPPLEPVPPANASLETLPETPPLVCLAHEFELVPFDLAVVLIALAPELDLRYERLYAYLQDDVTRRRPSIDLCLNLLCASAQEKFARRQRFAAEAPLLHRGLVQLVTDGGQPQPLLAHALKLDEQVVSRLLGERSLDARLAAFCERPAPRPGSDDPALDAERVRTLTSLALRARAEGRSLRLYFEGPSPGEQRRTAEAIAAALGSGQLAVDLGRIGGCGLPIDRALTLVFQQARRDGSLVYLERVETLTGDDELATLFAAVGQFAGPCLLAGERAWSALPGPTRAPALGVLAVPFGVPDAGRRRACWKAELGTVGETLPAAELDALAGRFRVTPDQIAAAASVARVRAQLRAAGRAGHEAAADLRIDDLFAAARAQSGGALAALSEKMSASYTWDDIVLPADALAQLREICRRVEYQPLVMDSWGFGRRLSLGKGVNALFAGPSGTGKTMAAEVIAAELGLDLYRIDLSGVVSKYIGETEKNLDRIFHAAESANAILFFDEADALFGKRSEVRDSHDRYANIEIAYLLQKMEQYDGLTILATNLRANLDESFTRRLAFTIHFPFPDEESRRAIWGRIWPADLPLGDDVDLDQLARRFKLTGGNVKNIALASAFLAAADGGPVRMRHLLQAVRREFQKLGKTLSDAELFGHAASPEAEAQR